MVDTFFKFGKLWKGIQVGTWRLDVDLHGRTTTTRQKGFGDTYLTAVLHGHQAVTFEVKKRKKV